MIIVLDTNDLLKIVPVNSKFYWIYEEIKKGNITLALSNEILSEYEEILSEFYSPKFAIYTIFTILNIPELVKQDIYFRWRLIKKDYDDNKFVDCAIACNAEYIITNDRHFKELKKIDFPKVNCITIEEFSLLLKK